MRSIAHVHITSNPNSPSHTKVSGEWCWVWPVLVSDAWERRHNLNVYRAHQQQSSATRTKHSGYTKNSHINNHGSMGYSSHTLRSLIFVDSTYLEQYSRRSTNSGEGSCFCMFWLNTSAIVPPYNDGLLTMMAAYERVLLHCGVYKYQVPNVKPYQGV